MRVRNDRGAVAVEFALLAPVLMTLLLGIIDFGFVFNAKIGITQAAREGVRVIALGGTTTEAQDRVAETLAANGQISGLTTTVPDDCTTGGDVGRVRVSGTVDFTLPIPDVTLTAEGVMRCNG